MINLLSFNSYQTNYAPLKCHPFNLTFKGNPAASKTVGGLNRDVFERSLDGLKSKLLEIRNAYIKTNPEAFLTLDHIKSNYDNSYIIHLIH